MRGWGRLRRLPYAVVVPRVAFVSVGLVAPGLPAHHSHEEGAYGVPSVHPFHDSRSRFAFTVLPCRL